MTEHHGAPIFDHELIRRYDRPGPRYTSYPTAPHFRDDFSLDDYRDEIRRVNEDDPQRPVSLYFHLPFCRSVCYFCGCNVHFTKDESIGDAYIDRVLAEMDVLAQLIGPERRVAQLHWGGGTPTFLPAPTLARLIDGYQSRFTFADEAEIGVEIDPREVTQDQLELMAGAGFNRISMGIQDFDPQVQEAVHRIQPEDLTRGVIDSCRALEFESINIDLIYGLPHQTADRFQETVDRIIEISPDRIAVFNFAYLPEMIRHQKAIRADALPDPEEKLRILEMVVTRLTDAGYAFIGMDHFARPDDELTVALENRTLYRNFQGYTTCAGADLVGIGATSIGQIGRIYAQNLKKTGEYQDAIDRDGLAICRGLRLSDDDLLRRDVITRLMCHFVLYKEEIEAAWGIDFDGTFGDAITALQPMAEDGLLSIHPERIEIHALGRLLVRNVAMCFDAYLDGDGAKRYSRTV